MFYVLDLISKSFWIVCLRYLWSFLVVIALSWERRSQSRIIVSFISLYIFFHSGSSSMICRPRCSSIFLRRPIRHSSWGPIGFIDQIRTSMSQIDASKFGTHVFRSLRQKSSVSFTSVTIIIRFKLLTSNFLLSSPLSTWTEQFVKGDVNGAWRSMWCITCSHGALLCFIKNYLWNIYFLCLSVRSNFSLSTPVKKFPCVVNCGWSSSLHIIAVIKVIQGRCFVAYFVLSFSTLACKLSIRTTDGIAESNICIIIWCSSL